MNRGAQRPKDMHVNTSRHKCISLWTLIHTHIHIDKSRERETRVKGRKAHKNQHLGTCTDRHAQHLQLDAQRHRPTLTCIYLRPLYLWLTVFPFSAESWKAIQQHIYLPGIHHAKWTLNAPSYSELPFVAHHNWIQELLLKLKNKVYWAAPVC